MSSQSARNGAINACELSVPSPKKWTSVALSPLGAMILNRCSARHFGPILGPSGLRRTRFKFVGEVDEDRRQCTSADLQCGYMNRKERAAVAAETVRIIDQGRYVSPSGAEVDIGEAMARAAAGTLTIGPDDRIPTKSGVHATRVEVVNETSLEGAAALLEAGHRVAVLNFASAKNPGGGFLSGSQAQEESLARSSGLVRLIERSPMYAVNRAERDPFYTDHVIYTPEVPVFRTDAGTLLESTALVSFVTAPAVNAGVVAAQTPRRTAEIATVMQRRVERVLGVLADRSYPAVVLGAWGCGVFRNRPDVIAPLFMQALAGPFRGAFARVRFSVLDTSDLQIIIRPFRDAALRAGL